MNWDVIEGNWKQIKGHVKEQWGKLSDDQLDMVITAKAVSITRSVKGVVAVRNHIQIASNR